MNYKYWLPAILWMAVIFVFSTDLFSAEHTGSILEFVLRKIRPDISEDSLDILHFCVRKGAHIFSYALLSLFYTFGFTNSYQPRTRWDWKIALAAVGLCFLYAATDEWHQSFSIHRTASAVDVMYDAAGAAFSQLVLSRK